MKKKAIVKTVLMLACICALSMAMTLTCSAASTKKVYGNFLKRQSSRQYFTQIDINRDGTRELLVSSDKYGTWLQVYTVKGGRIKNLGQVLNKYQNGVRYNPKRKALVLANGGAGASGNSLWKISGGKLRESSSTMMLITGRRIIYQHNYKKCSAKTYRSKTKLYFGSGQVKLAKFKKNTSANRKKLK